MSSSRRARSAPKATVSASVRLGLESIVEGNERSIRAMLSLDEQRDVVEGLVDCMGVNSLSAEMLMANYFSAGMLGAYCRERIGKSDKGGAATLAERIAREWAPSDRPPVAQPFCLRSPSEAALQRWGFHAPTWTNRSRISFSPKRFRSRGAVKLGCCRHHTPL